MRRFASVIGFEAIKTKVSPVFREPRACSLVLSAGFPAVLHSLQFRQLRIQQQPVCTSVVIFGLQPIQRPHEVTSKESTRKTEKAPLAKNISPKGRLHNCRKKDESLRLVRRISIPTTHHQFLPVVPKCFFFFCNEPSTFAVVTPDSRSI